MKNYDANSVSNQEKETSKISFDNAQSQARDLLCLRHLGIYKLYISLRPINDLRHLSKKCLTITHSDFVIIVSQKQPY
jgi:hypothetical protein